MHANIVVKQVKTPLLTPLIITEEVEREIFMHFMYEIDPQLIFIDATIKCL